MKPIKMIFIIMFLLASLIVKEKACCASGGNFIYLLDVSGSMEKGGLFENIKIRLKQLVREQEPGDRIVLITFGDDVLKVIDVEIRNRQDIEEINRLIDNLRPVSPWTWMSKAFQRTKDIAEDLRAKSPDKPITIYLLTDCENDPPPHVKKTEPPWKFVEVLTTFFKDFQVKDTYLYLLSYRPLAEDEKETIKRQTKIQIKEPGVGKPIPSEIILEASGFDFGEIEQAAGPVERAGEITVRKIAGTATEETLHLSVPAPINIDPPTLTCRRRGQKEKVTLKIPAKLNPGKYNYSFQLNAANAVVKPPQVNFSFTIPPPPKDAVLPSVSPKPDDKEPPRDDKAGNFLKWLLAILALCGAAFLIWRFVKPPTAKSVWIETGSQDIYEAFIRGQQKLWLGEQTTSEYLDLDLADYYLTIEGKGHLMLCQESSGEKLKVRFDQEMPCKMKEGAVVKLRFHETDPRPPSAAAEPGSDRPKGPMDEI